MKKLVGIILATAITTFALADAILGFINNSGIHYFSEQPNQLLLVAVIGIIGGLVAFGFSALSPRLQRGVKLFVLGLGALSVMLGGGYLSFQVANLPIGVDPSTLRFVSDIPRHIPWLLLLGTIGISGVLLLEFYQVLKSRDRVA